MGCDTAKNFLFNNFFDWNGKMRSTIQPALLLVLALFCSLSTQSVDAQQLRLDFERVENGVTQRFQASSPARLVTESYTAKVPYTENVTQKYTVKVPYTENVVQKYKVQVPYTETITGEDGKERKVQRTRAEERVRTATVTKTRSETRTRMVPIIKTRAEKRTRQVPAGKKVEIPFPPANASFAYVSGKKITREQVKAIAAEKTITILRLSSGQMLTELHRQTLKPDLIVMTIRPGSDEPLEK